MIKLLSVGLALLGLAACASYKPVVYEKSSSAVVKVALVDDIISQKPVAYGGQGVSSAFGAIGALAAIQIAEDRSAKMRAALDTISYNPEQRLRDQISSGLSAAGYTVSFVDIGERTKPSKVAEFVGAPEGTDAYVDVHMVWGFNAARTKLWVPTVGADIRLIRAGDKTLLAKDAIIVNPALELTGITVLPVAKEEGAESFEALVANPQAMAGWLDAAFDRVVAEVISKLD